MRAWRSNPATHPMRLVNCRTLGVAAAFAAGVWACEWAFRHLPQHTCAVEVSRSCPARRRHGGSAGLSANMCAGGCSQVSWREGACWDCVCGMRELPVRCQHCQTGPCLVCCVQVRVKSSHTGISWKTASNGALAACCRSAVRTKSGWRRTRVPTLLCASYMRNKLAPTYSSTARHCCMNTHVALLRFRLATCTRLPPQSRTMKCWVRGRRCEPAAAAAASSMPWWWQRSADRAPCPAIGSLRSTGWWHPQQV